MPPSGIMIVMPGSAMVERRPSTQRCRRTTCGKTGQKGWKLEKTDK